MQLKHILLATLAPLWALAAQAQNLPKPTQLYPAGSFTPMATPTDAQVPTAMNNSVTTYTPWIPLTDTASLNSYSDATVTRQQTVYLDGYSRPYQSITLNVANVNNVGKHQVQPYDNRYQRDQYSFLPYATTNPGVSLAAFQEQRAYYSSQYYDEGYSAFVKTANTSTSGERSTTSYAPGKSQVGMGVGTVTKSVTNPASQVLIWNLDASGTPVAAGYYAAGELIGTETAGPDASGSNSSATAPRSRAYNDREGNLVLKLTADTVGSFAYTYYVYDALGRLRCTITPKAYKYYLQQGNLANNNLLGSLCFQYRYDAKGRLCATRQPGEDDYTYLVYDRKDRPVMRQTPNERAAAEWEVTFTDALGRTKVTGIYRDAQGTPLTQAGWQNLLDTWSSGGPYADLVNYLVTPALEAQYPVGSNPMSDPAGNAYSAIANHTVMTIQYYDNYDRLGNVTALANECYSNTNLPSMSAPGLEDPAVGRCYGLPTGSIVRILRSPSALSARAGDWNRSVVLYDDKGHPILGKSEVLDAAAGYNMIRSDYTAQQYDFAGRLLQSGHRFYNAGSQNHTLGSSHIEYTRNQYDPFTGAPVKTIHKVDDNGWATLATFQYDDLGRLSRKTLGSGGEVQDLTYNIRGQLTGINGVYAESANKGGYSKSFGESLKYDYGFTQNRLDGRIAGTIWRGSSALDRYGYDYTQSGQLKRADFNHTENGIGNWGHATMDYSVSNLFYDKNGNLLSMKQRGVKPGTGPVDMDNMNYLYENNDLSNRLKQVTDGGTADYGAGDLHGTAASTYDANGNQRVETGNRNIADISYTRFNRPVRIAFTNGNRIEYSYDATGNKVEELVYTGTQLKRTDYAGNVVYQYTAPAAATPGKTDSLQYISTGEGRTTFNLSTSRPQEEYFVKDHLGNLRSVVTSAAYDMRQYLATYELASANLEQFVFDNVDNVRTSKPGGGGDNTMAALLNGSYTEGAVGTSLMLHVMAGDKVGLNVNTYYNGYNPDYDQPRPADEIVNQLMATLGNGAGGLFESESHNYDMIFRLITPDNFVAYNSLLDKISDPTKPRAYLNYLLFDENMQPVQQLSGAFQASGDGQWAQIGTSSDLEIPVNGYLVAYISNQSAGTYCPSCSDVYFDQLNVQLSQGKLLEETHYYPHGLPIFGLASSTTIDFTYRRNRQKYQGNEYITDAGLNWMSFGARQYDPQIGRFLSVDPLAAFGGQDSYSPYAAMGNQPESMIDPNGLSPYDFPIISGVRVEAARNYGGEMGGGPGSRAWYDGGMGGYDDRGMSYGLMAFGNITNLIGVNAQRSFARMTGQTDRLTGDAKIGTGGEGGNGVGGIGAAYRRNSTKQEGGQTTDLVIFFPGADFGQGTTESTSKIADAIGKKSNVLSIIMRSMYANSDEENLNEAVGVVISFLKNSPKSKVLLYGYSYGGDLVNQFAKALGKEGINVTYMAIVDGTNGFQNNVNKRVGKNVGYTDNFYQAAATWPTGGVLHGGPLSGPNTVNNYPMTGVNHMTIDDVTANTIIRIMQSFLRRP